MITIETNHGNIVVEMDKNETPDTCANFINYVREGFYDKTLFHRVIDGFMIQGGGFDTSMSQKDSGNPIHNEAHKGNANKRGTIAMARTAEPHSASSQFFINLRDNDFLDFRSEDYEGWGYCVFGRVVEGMDVVDKISKVDTGQRSGHDDVPVEDVIVTKVTVDDDENN